MHLTKAAFGAMIAGQMKTEGPAGRIEWTCLQFHEPDQNRTARVNITMDILTIDLNAPGTKDLFLEMFQKRNLVPIIGAGFTKGASTTGGNVPDADQLKMIMLKAIERSVGTSDAQMLLDKPLNEVADVFLNSEFVPTDTAKDVLKRNFIGVKLPSDQSGFLDCPWPCIYTLNIDDAIETHSRFREKVLPNRNISKLARDLDVVYKVHGDVADELIYGEPSKIIFSTAQYVKSLTKNASMLSSLRAELVEKNTIFVGCSLAYEIDLLYALAEHDGRFPPSRLSIYVTSRMPGKFEQSRLKQHGINRLIIVDNYSDFYNTIANFGQEQRRIADPLTKRYLVEGRARSLDDDYRANLQYLLRDSSQPRDDGYSILPDFYQKRDIEDDLIAAVREHALVLLKGRRFSGKTLLLRSVANSINTMRTYLFESNTQVDPDIIDELVLIPNGLFVFDSNALDYASCELLLRRLRDIQQAGSRVLVAANPTEPDISATLSRALEDGAFFELSSRFSTDELEGLNAKLDHLGITRLPRGKTILEATYWLLGKYEIETTELTKVIPLEDAEIPLLAILAITDKVYSSVAISLGILTTQLLSFARKMAPILDIAECAPSESRSTGSKYKLVANSGLGLLLQIERISIAHGPSRLSAAIARTVQALVGQPRFVAIAENIYMFDAINHLLTRLDSKRASTGYRKFVMDLYESLQPVLSESPNYWLQRAKAILQTESRSDSILDGINYARKAFNDTDRNRTRDNAEFTLALLYGKLASVTSYTETETTVQAIRWYSRALNNYTRNAKYVDTMLGGQRHGLNPFHELCNFLENNEIKDIKFLEVRAEVQHLLDYRREWLEDAQRKP